MNLKEILSGRIGIADIRNLCIDCAGPHNDEAKARLYSLINDSDDRVGYNALWIFTHFQTDDKIWLQSKRTELIDILLTTLHTGKRRLLLTLLDCLETTISDVNAEYLNFCISKINSTEPYAIRALCMKQAFAQCKFYPELIQELSQVIEMMDYNELSPGLSAAKRNILKKMTQIKLK